MVNNPTIADLFRRRYTPPGVMWEVEERAQEWQKRALRAEEGLHKLKGAADLFRQEVFAQACHRWCDADDSPYRDNSECHTNCYIGKAWKKLEEALTKAKEVLEDEQA